MAWLEVLAFRSVNISAILRIEAMQSMRLLVDKCIVLWHELPADFRRDYTGLGGRVGRGGSR